MQDLSCGESSNTEQNTSTDLPNGLTPIQESVSNKSLDKSPRSPSSSSSEMTTSHSKLNKPRPLGATKNLRRSSESSVTKKPASGNRSRTSSSSTSKISGSNPGSTSVSTSKIPGIKSPLSKKHT